MTVFTTHADATTVVVDRGPTELLIAYATEEGCGSFSLTHEVALQLATDLILAGMPAEQFREGLKRMVSAPLDPQRCPDAENHHPNGAGH